METNGFSDYVMFVVSRAEVNSNNTSRVLSNLKSLIETPERARQYKEIIDISFDGYEGTSDELFEILEVRNFVHSLDEQFPYWLYFLSKKTLGLHAILYCFLSPFLTKEAKTKIHPKEIDRLLDYRWVPALSHISAFAGMDDNEYQAIVDRTIQYIFNGPLRIKGAV